MAFKVPEKYRVTRSGYPPYDQNHALGDLWGVFMIPTRKSNAPLKVIACCAADDYPWDHVSVSLPTRCPTWGEMCQVKDLFWDEDDVVAQYHPAKKDYVNCHKYCLHLWRPTQDPLPCPPTIMVGVPA